MYDAARNVGWAEFTGGRRFEQPPKARLRTSNPDTKPPELDLNRIRVDAEPTNPEAPDGETIVTVTFRVRDNISGYHITSFRLRDPQGVTHRMYHRPPDYSSLFAIRDPTEWATHTLRHVLPAGSAPGLWGIYEMNLLDKARNFISHNFTELFHFEVD